MLVQFEGADYAFDLEALDVSEARYIKRVTGFTIKALLTGLQELDPEALVALYWLMRKQNGTVEDMSKVNFKVIKFGEALEAAFDAEAEKKKENPTEADPAATA